MLSLILFNKNVFEAFEWIVGSPIFIVHYSNHKNNSLIINKIDPCFLIPIEVHRRTSLFEIIA